MLGFFEKRLDPFPSERYGAPPQTLAAFCWHYVKDARSWIITVSVLSALMAVGEVALYGLLGRLVDWLTDADRSTFFAETGSLLVIAALAIVVVLPALALLSSLVTHQTLLGNLPMSARWRMHNQLLSQS
ncbi:MAG: ABC transporter ATP-binding protein, partial [Pseudomonadota bacterium]